MCKVLRDFPWCDVGSAGQVRGGFSMQSWRQGCQSDLPGSPPARAIVVQETAVLVACVFAGVEAAHW